MKSTGNQQRWLVRFKGNVQGVGFRQTCCEYACPLKITGWVRNLGNGDVEMVAEGLAENLQMFVKSIEENTSGNVSDREVEVHTATQEFSSFLVAR